MNSENQSQAQKHNQKVQQQASHSVLFNNQPRATLDRRENYPFFKQYKQDQQTSYKESTT